MLDSGRAYDGGEGDVSSISIAIGAKNRAIILGVLARMREIFLVMSHAEARRGIELDCNGAKWMRVRWATSLSLACASG